MNREIQVSRFVVCNGKFINIFDTNKLESLLYLSFADATPKEWEQLFDLLNPFAFSHPNLANYKQDYGMWCWKNGLVNEVQHVKNGFIADIAKLNDNTYTITATVQREGQEFIASFDFDISLYKDFIAQVPAHLEEAVDIALRNAPFTYMTTCEEESFPLCFCAILSEYVVKNANEEFLPFTIRSFG